MKRTRDYMKLSDRLLAAALAFLIMGSGFALLNAFSGGTVTSLAPLLLAA